MRYARRSLPTIAVIAGLVAALAGCAGSESPPDAVDSTPVDGGTLNWAIPGEPAAGGIDPIMAISLDAQEVQSLAYDTLLTRDDSGEPQPALATSWEKKNDLTYVFTLREGVKFADDEPFTAQDVVYSFETYLSEPTSKKAYIVNLADVEAHGDYEVTFTLSKPDGTFLNAVSAADTFFIINSKSYAAATEDERQTQTFGSGPFGVTEWQNGVSITMEKNSRYWGPGPHIDTIVFPIIPDESARLAALQQGTVQAAYFTDGVTAQQAVDAGFAQGALSNTRPLQVYLNPESGPLSDIRVRQALSLSLDRQALADSAMLGYGAASLLPPVGYPSAPAPDGETPFYVRDVEAAKELLAEAGQEHPVIRLQYLGDRVPSHHPVYELMQQQAAEAGIQLELAATPIAEQQVIATQGKSFEGMVSVPGSMRPDSLFFFDPFLSPTGNLNHWKENPDADEARAILEQARAETDPNAKQELVEKLADEMAQQVLMLIPVAVPVIIETWDENALMGYSSDPYNSRRMLTESWLSQHG